jgi:hypothetical protein
MPGCVRAGLEHARASSARDGHLHVWHGHCPRLCFPLNHPHLAQAQRKGPCGAAGQVGRAGLVPGWPAAGAPEGALAGPSHVQTDPARFSQDNLPADPGPRSSACALCLPFLQPLPRTCIHIHTPLTLACSLCARWWMQTPGLTSPSLVSPTLCRTALAVVRLAAGSKVEAAAVKGDSCSGCGELFFSLLFFWRIWS